MFASAVVVDFADHGQCSGTGGCSWGSWAPRTSRPDARTADAAGLALSPLVPGPLARMRTKRPRGVRHDGERRPGGVRGERPEGGCAKPAT